MLHSPYGDMELHRLSTPLGRSQLHLREQLEYKPISAVRAVASSPSRKLTENSPGSWRRVIPSLRSSAVANSNGGRSRPTREEEVRGLMNRIAVALAIGVGAAIPMAASADSLGKSVVTAPFGGPSRNAMPNDQEEMNQRELCARRNLQNNGTIYGNCAPAPLQPKTSSGRHCPGFNSMTARQCAIIHQGYDAANCTCTGN